MLHFLAALDSGAELAALLARPACPHAPTDAAGRTPLMVALSHGHTVAARLLLRAHRRRELPWGALWAQLGAASSAAAGELAALATAAEAGLRSARAAEREAHALCSSIAHESGSPGGENAARNGSAADGSPSEERLASAQLPRARARRIWAESARRGEGRRRAWRAAGARGARARGCARDAGARAAHARV